MLTSTGLSYAKDLLFEDEYRGDEDRVELQGYISAPLVRSTINALNDGREYCLLIYNSLTLISNLRVLDTSLPSALARGK